MKDKSDMKRTLLLTDHSGGARRGPHAKRREASKGAEFSAAPQRVMHDQKNKPERIRNGMLLTYIDVK